MVPLATITCIGMGIVVAIGSLAWGPMVLAQALVVAPRPRPYVQLDAAFDPPARRITGTVRWVIPNVSDRALADVPFWLYPNRLGDRPAALGDVNFHWLYPNGFSPAAMRIDAARVGASPAPVGLESSPAGPRTLARVRLPTAVPPGGEVEITVDFTTDLPVRLGGFGCAASGGRACRMMGGFYPFPPHLGSAGFEQDAPPDRVDFAARIVVPPGTDVLLGNAYARSSAGGVAAKDINVPYITLVVDRTLRADSVDAGGMRVVFFHHGTRPPSSGTEVLPYVREDRTGLVLDAARRALTFIAAAGLMSKGQGTGPAVVLIESPLRHELVQIHGNVILVSDRLFEIFPLERLRRLHRLELIHAVVAAFVNRVVRDTEPDTDVDLSTDVVSAYLTEVFTRQELRRLEFAPDILRPFSFIPAVDQLIHAPLVASASSYFGDVDDRDVVRDDVRRFSHQRAGGRLVSAKLLDLLGRAGMERVTRLVLVEGGSLRQAASRVFGSSLDWFWRQWANGPLARVNYRLARLQTAPLPSHTGGDRGRGVRVILDVQRQGPALFEPVEVQILDRDGVAHDLIWTDPGPSRRFELDLPAGLASVEIDPRHRLVESAVGSLDPDDDPLVDNREPKPWRFIYSGAGALLDVTALTASFAAAVRLKPRHDLRNSILVLAYRSPSTQVGVESAYTRLFGHQADRNRLASAVGVGLSASLLEPSFGVADTETLRPRWRLSGELFVEHDDRDFLIDPWRAVGVTAGINYAVTGLETGARLSQINTSVELLRLFELAPGHVLALDAQSGVTFGDIRVRSQLAQIGGATALRGFAPDELFGRGQAVGRVELRNRYVSDLDWNLAHLTSVRGFGGNIFFEAGAVTSCADLSVGKNDVFADVGYSFRVLHDAFGVYQQLLSVDLAIPLNRHDRVCAGWHSLGPPDDPGMRIRRAPFVVLVSFLPNF